MHFICVPSWGKTVSRLYKDSAMPPGALQKKANQLQ
jgi:hypothetical protein